MRRLLGLLALPLTLVACGGGGGGGGSAPPVTTPTTTPTSAPTTAPTSAPTSSSGGSFVAATGPATVLAANSANSFGSTILANSTTGTFILQSTETPAEGASPTPIPEYNVSGTETAGLSTSSVRRTPATLAHPALLTLDGTVPRAPRLDAGTSESPTRQTLQRHPLHVAPESVRYPDALRRTKTLTVGQTMPFYVDQFKINGTSSTCTNPVSGYTCYTTVTATLLAVSNSAYVWIDNAVGPGTPYGLTTSDAQAIGAQFDLDIATEQTAFGATAYYPGTSTPTFEQCDANGTPLPNSSYGAVPDLTNADPHIGILITNALETEGEGGYFSFANLLSDAELKCNAASGPIEKTNATKLFIAGADGYEVESASGAISTVYDESYWKNYDMPRTISHEFQHYLHALNKYFIPTLTSNGAKGVIDDAFVDEGCSMLAEDLTSPGFPNVQSQDSSFLAFFYLYAPSNFTLTSFSAYDTDPFSTSATPPYIFQHNTAGNYGEAYLFARYLYDRFGTSALQNIYKTTTSFNSTTQANTQPIVAAAGGENFAQLYGEFAAALMLSGTGTTTDPRYTFNSNVRLRGATNFASPGGTTVYAQYQGPRSPVDFTSSSPGTAARIKFTPGSSVAAKLLQGATLFFNAANVQGGSGNTVRAQITGAPAGGTQAAVTQSSTAAYTDTPGACAAPQPSTTCHP